MKEYHDFLLEMFDLVKQTKAMDVEVSKGMPSFDAWIHVSGPFHIYEGLDDSILQECPMGHVSVVRFHEWWKELEWGAGAPISLHELYFARLQTRTVAPVVVGFKKYALREHSNEADIAPLKLTLQVKTWDRMVEYG